MNTKQDKGGKTKHEDLEKLVDISMYKHSSDRAEFLVDYMMAKSGYTVQTFPVRIMKQFEFLDLTLEFELTKDSAKKVADYLERLNENANYDKEIREIAKKGNYKGQKADYLRIQKKYNR